MKTTSIILTSLLVHLTTVVVPVAAAEHQIGVHILEDVSGPELLEHGIKSADFEDMQALADVLFATRRSAQISYDVVDEDGHDNPTHHFSITPFDKPIPTRPDFKGMVVREKMLALQKFQAEAAAFRTESDAWKTRVIEGAIAWLDQCIEHRLEVEDGFMQRIKANPGSNFKRSDLIGSIQMANQALTAAKVRILVLNTDMNHQAGKAAQNEEARPLGVADIAEDVILILVNTSLKPDQSILLKEVPNKILHAESLKQAAERIAAELAARPELGSDKSSVTP